MAITKTKYNPKDTLKHVESLINKNEYKERETAYGYDKPENAMPFSRELGNSVAELMLQVQKDYYKFISSSEQSVGAYIGELSQTINKLTKELTASLDYKKYQYQIIRVQEVSAEVTTLLNKALDTVTKEKNDAMIKMYNNLGDVKKVLKQDDGGKVELSKIKKSHEECLKTASKSLDKIKEILNKAYQEADEKVNSVAQGFDGSVTTELRRILNKNQQTFSDIDKKGTEIQDALNYIPQVPDLSQVEVPILFTDKNNKAVGVEGYSTPFLMMPGQKPKDFANLLTSAMKDVTDVCDIIDSTEKQAKKAKEKSLNPYLADLEKNIKHVSENILNFFDKTVKQIIPQEVFELSKEAKKFLEKQKEHLDKYDKDLGHYGNLKNILVNDTGILGTQKLDQQIKDSMKKIGKQAKGVVGEMLNVAGQKTMGEFNNIMGSIPFLKDIFSQHMSGSQNELSKMGSIKKHGPRGGISMGFQPSKFDSENGTIKKAEQERLRAVRGCAMAESKRAQDAKKILKKLEKEISEKKTSKISAIGIENGDGKLIGGLSGNVMGTRIEQFHQRLVNGASYSMAYSQQNSEVRIREEALDANKNMDNKNTLTNKSKDCVSSVVGSCDRTANWAINAYTNKIVKNYHIDSIRKENVDLHSQSEQGLLQTQLPREEIVTVFVDLAQNNYDAAVDTLEHLDNVKGRIDEWKDNSHWMKDFNNTVKKLKITFNTMKTNKNILRKSTISKLFDLVKNFSSKFIANFEDLLSSDFNSSSGSSNNETTEKALIGNINNGINFTGQVIDGIGQLTDFVETIPEKSKIYYFNS